MQWCWFRGYIYSISIAEFFFFFTKTVLSDRICRYDVCLFSYVELLLRFHSLQRVLTPFTHRQAMTFIPHPTHITASY